MSQLLKKEHEFKVDLRIEGIAQDVILKDDERMGEICSGRSVKTRKTP